MNRKNVKFAEFLLNNMNKTRLESYLMPKRKSFPRYLADEFESIISLIGKEEQKEEEEAFSFPEIIDKFIIVAIKNEYITDKKIREKNHKDYHFLLNIIKKKMKLRSEKHFKKTDFVKTLYFLWKVNVEIFILNDICQMEQDDSLVADSSRKMVEMMKERNRLKHLIGEYTNDIVHEVKQYGL